MGEPVGHRRAEPEQVPRPSHHLGRAGHRPHPLPALLRAGLTLGSCFIRHTLPAFEGWEVQQELCRLRSGPGQGVLPLRWVGLQAATWCRTEDHQSVDRTPAPGAPHGLESPGQDASPPPPPPGLRSVR